MSWQVFNKASERGHENICFFYDEDSGLKAIVAIHSTVLGPALGGCRIRDYKTEEEALEDVMRLAEGMTYKNSIAGLDLGGGKACIISPNNIEEGRDKLFRKFGEYLDGLSGRYITAEDMGTRVSDMTYVREKTNCVVGFPIEEGGSGDPSPWTALGVYKSVETIKKRLGLDNLSVAIQGVGKVGYYLAKHLVENGAKVYATDTSDKNLEKAKNDLGVEVVGLSEIYDVDCNIFSPCAVGQTVNKNTVPRLKVKAIVGAANNQISEPEINQMLREKGIIYCPDFVINSGGVISVGAELNEGGWKEEWVRNKIDEISPTLEGILDTADKEQKPAEEVAINKAKERIAIKSGS